MSTHEGRLSWQAILRAHGSTGVANIDDYLAARKIISLL